MSPSTFPAGQSTETVAVPINPGAANPGLVPIDLAVTSRRGQVKGSSTTVTWRAARTPFRRRSSVSRESPAESPITFSKPMDPATVAEHSQLRGQVFARRRISALKTCTVVGLVQTLDNTTKKIPLRRATYNPATNTVLLVATEQLGSKGSYQISNPASLLAKKPRPSNAHPLTDLEATCSIKGEEAAAFSITIGKGKPYAAVGADPRCRELSAPSDCGTLTVKCRQLDADRADASVRDHHARLASRCR